MPIIKSAKKALRVGGRRKNENDLVRAKIKNAVKGARLSIATKKDDVNEKLQALYHELDIAAKKNVIHRNKAARLKSRITKKAKAVIELPESKPQAKKTQKTAKKTTKK